MTKNYYEIFSGRSYCHTGGVDLTLNHGHLRADDLESYSMNSLPDESAERVERHLLICETCRQRLIEAEAYMTAMKGAARGLQQPERAAKRRWWSFPRLVPAFAALAFLAIAAVTFPLIHRGATAPFAVNLQTMRGPNQATAPSRRPLVLSLDLTGLAASPSYRIDMVDQSGNLVWKGEFKSLGSTGSVAIPPQKRGSYFVRVALPSGDTLREYGLQLRGND
jgi:hypothetical protein